MKTTFQVRVRRDGRLTLPRELRDRVPFKSGATLTLYDLGNGVVVISSTRPRFSAIADKLAREWREAGLSLDSMLATLRQVRKERDARKR